MKELFIPTKKNNYKPYLLRKGLLVFYTIILVVVNTFGGALGISKISASDITATTLISLTNQERSAAGLNTLKTNAKLTAAAKAKAQNMFEEQYWDHFGPNGETPWQFIIAEGYNYVYAGENLAKGFRTSEGVVEAWMASPTHRDNILSKNYKDIGIAVVSGELLGKETILVVQMFGNLTTEVYGSSTETETKTVTPVTKSTVIESGQIKAISITNPKVNDILSDPTILIQGEVEGDKDDYTVEVYDLDSSIGEVDGEGDSWEYSSEDIWEDGSHELEAKVKGTSVVSDKVSFTVDTSSPTIVQESLAVIKDENTYTITFDTDEAWDEIKVISNGEEVSFSSEDGTEIVLENFTPGDSVVLSVSDEAGNTSEVDISEYFLEGDSEESTNFSWALLVNSIKTTDGINVIVAGFILVLLSIEVFVLWRKGKLGKSIGDLFVIMLWVTILTIGIFKGFGGISV
ncbi:MAG: CAP domain-containing protein [Candidatus Dojkabacteria bacterium]|nr:CAP domain-containing protein [Candidatus Dojkabacteria bacterium]